MTPKTLLALAATLAAAPAFAQVSWYAGLGGGQSRTSIDYVRNRESTLVLVQTAQTDFDDRDAAFKAFAGLRFNSAVALELAYVDLGKAHTATRGLGGDPPFPYGSFLDRKVTGIGLDIVGTAPLIPQRLELVGKAGVYRTHLETTATLEGNIVFSNAPGDTRRSSDRKEDTVHLGVGLQYWINPRWAIRAEYERFLNIGKPFAVGGTGTTGEADVDAAWVSAVFRF
jgi:opacity protein-like surface antigen